MGVTNLAADGAKQTSYLSALVTDEHNRSGQNSDDARL
jgi:hypothetical protein